MYKLTGIHLVKAAAVLVVRTTERNHFAVSLATTFQYRTAVNIIIAGNTPKNLNPFLPASLDNLFPTMPPLGTYYVPVTGFTSLLVP